MIWLFNFDTDFELSRPSYTPPAALLADLARHGAPAVDALMSDGDTLLTHITPAHVGQLGRAWCPTPRALARFAAAGVTPEPHPPVDVLRRVNHRLFAHRLGGGLPGQRYVTTFPDLSGGPWLLKRPLTCAGRGQLRVTGPLGPKQRAWIDKSLRHDGLIVEPLVTPSLELSLHGFITGRSFRLGRVVDHRRMQLAEEPRMIPQAERVAQALIDAGYFGPFGIDGYLYEGGLCTLSEINARYTMAFALGFGRPPQF